VVQIVVYRPTPLIPAWLFVMAGIMLRTAIFCVLFCGLGVAEAAPSNALRGRALSQCGHEWAQCDSPSVPNQPSCCEGLVCVVGSDWWASCQSSGSTPMPTQAPTAQLAAPTSAPTPQPTSSGSDGAWTIWSGSGITYHDDHSYEVDTYCAENHDMIHMCWYMDDEWVAQKPSCDNTCQAAKQFQQDNVMSQFCQRSDRIAFGHPVDNNCGECVEIRVLKSDGTYNMVTVMTVDNPKIGWGDVPGDTSSPELSKAAKEYLTEGVVFNNVQPPREAELNDRLPFEYRTVPCTNN